MANYQNILRQAHQAIADVADNADSWRAFLRSAAYTTHYAFPNQALIYSQRPGATMLADIDTWNRAAGRWVNRGAHGVASLGTGNMAGNVRYLFDIKDTHPAGKASKPLGWQITDANRYPTLQALQEKHSAESLPEIFGLQAALFVAQHGKQLDADLQNAVIGSTLEWAKPQEQTAIFANLITQSAVYMAAVRCGLGDSAVPQDAFADIDRFDTESAVLALGNAVNRAGRQMFAEMRSSTALPMPPQMPCATRCITPSAIRASSSLWKPKPQPGILVTGRTSTTPARQERPWASVPIISRLRRTMTVPCFGWTMPTTTLTS